MIDLTVVTPSIPGRRQWLYECIASVDEQTVKPAGHIISIGKAAEGQPKLPHIVETRNRLCMAVDTAWVSSLDDDDLFDPTHFETVAPYLDGPYDLIYTYAHGFPSQDCSAWNGQEIVDALGRHNWIGMPACIRLETVWAAGGWSIEGWNPETYYYGEGPCWAEDWDLWLRMAQIGARFLCIPQETWHYRLDSPDRTTHAAMAVFQRRG
jgi:hypothetical protein